jgi:8-oxo-dGTP diphosphatase
MVTKSYDPERGLMKYPCVALIIENPKHEVLLLLRDNKPEIAYPNHWSLVGGHVEEGETAEQAAIRELSEEVGLDLKISLWKRYDYDFAPGVVIDQHIFVGKVDIEKPGMTLGEGQAMQFFKHNEVKELNIGFGFDIILNNYFEMKQE